MAVSQTRQRRYGFTLVELTICCVIVFVLFLIVVYPVMSHSHRGSRQSSCASNQKQIALGFLQYVQDYDGRFPPIVGYTYLDYPGTSMPDKTQGEFTQSWGPDRTLPDGRVISGLLCPYTKANALFHDPLDTHLRGLQPTLDYMYNDLLAMHKQGDLNALGATVLTTDAEDRLANAGHAFTPDSGPFAARFTFQGTCAPGQGASVRYARFRHSDGAIFSFTDGHVRWFTGGPTDRIFFPPRESASPSAIDVKTKQQLGPIPGGDMTFQGHVYAGTFHLR